MNSSTENAINKIHQFQKFGSILGLERMNRLLELLGNPQEGLPIIHVAGTNGKGSVCRYMYSVLQEAGYRTGLFTSPFLEKFNERIEFDGSHISDEDLKRCTDKVLEAVSIMTKDGQQSPTEFEVITAMALIYFKEQRADYIILEVGLGGKGDSTNVCREPLMTVITSISMDHTDRLGDTIEAIAGEKAGIIKDGCPLVTSASDPRALKVIRDVATQHQSMVFETCHLPVTIKEESLTGTVFDLDLQGVFFRNIAISMIGRHQVENAVAALTAISIMEEQGKIKIKKEDLYAGILKACQPGRFQVMSKADSKPLVIVDGAHNEDGARALAETCMRLCKNMRILMVTGVLADKDIEAIVSNFAKITKDFIVTEPDSSRRMEAEALAQRLSKLGGQCICEPDLNKAYEIACHRGEGYDLILYAGSLYLIGRIRQIIKTLGE